MAQGSIGRAALILSANSAKLTSGLGSAAASIGKWAGSLGKGTLAKPLGALASVGKVAGMGMAAGLGAGFALKGVDAIGDLMTAAPERLGELSRLGTTGTAFGLQPEAFTGIAGVAKSAGSDLRDFTEALVTLSGRGTEAMQGMPDASAAFQRLGLDAGKFTAMPVDDQFYAIFEALNKVQNPAERVQLLLKSFGEDSGKNLIPLLGKTTAELKGMAGQYSKSAEDIAAAQTATEAMSRANAALGNAFDSIVIAMAPALEYFADLIPVAIEAIAPLFAGMGGGVMPVLKGVTVAVGYVWDSLKVGGGVMAMVAGKIVEGLGTIIQALGDVVRWMAEVLPESLRPDWLDGMGQAINDLGGRVDRFGEQAGAWGEKTAVNAVVGFGEGAAAMDRFFTDFENRRASAVKKHVDQLRGATTVARQLAGPQFTAVGAAVRGSADAAAAAARFQTQSKIAASKEQAQLLAAANKQVGVLERIDNNTRGLLPVGVMQGK